MAQQDRIQKLSDVVLESKKEAQTNADTLHNLLVGIENLGENVKNMQEEMIAWQSGYQEAEREYEEMHEDLLKEVPPPAQAVRPQEVVNPLPVSVPLVPTSQFHNSESRAVIILYSWSFKERHETVRLG